MALPPTRLTTLLYQAGSDAGALARLLLSERLIVRGKSAEELQQFIQSILDRTASEPPRPGPTWADRLSAALSHSGFLNKSGQVWATLDPPRPQRAGLLTAIWEVISAIAIWRRKRRADRPDIQ